MDVFALAQKFWDDGYLVLENFYPEALMDEVNALILNHFGDQPEFIQDQDFLNKSKTEVIPWFPQREGVAAFDTVGNHPVLNSLTTQILGEGWQTLYCMVMFSKQGTAGQQWHQDCPPENAHAFNLNRLVYSHDISADIGGQTVIVPGTHKKGLIPAGKADEDIADHLVLSPRKGTLVLLHGHTWHRVLPVHGRYRISTNYRSIPQGTPENVTDIGVYRNMRYRFSTKEVLEERATEG